MLAGTVLIPAVLMVVAVGCDSVARGHAPEDLFTTVARARVRSVAVFDEPGGKRPHIALSNPDAAGAPLVFIVRNTDQSWLQVELPVRPNGSLGWISRRNVELSRHDYRIVVDLGAHMITVSRGARIVDKEPVGIGTRDTPTPGGSYYTTALVQPPDPSGLYGPYVYVLSGYSDVLRDFAGGNGVIGIHGTNEPWDLGKNVSHGCIRMSNNGITRLAHMLPLGVPVDIRP
jgi:lipoprotein-anchoring transpeptidase ErfK/SrfK